MPNYSISNLSAPFTPPASDSECAPCDLDEVADLLWKFYKLLADMAYILQGDIKYPPHRTVAPSLFTKREVTRLGLDPRVAELIQKIPYIDPSNSKPRDLPEADPTTSKHFEVLPNTKVVLYGIYQALQDSRNPYRIRAKADSGYIEPWQATIWMSDGPVLGTSIIFDTRTGEILGFKTPRDRSPTRPAFYCRGASTLSASEFFTHLMTDFRSLKVVPWNRTILDYDDHLLPYIKHIYTICGWPKKFLKPDFRVLRKRFNKWLEPYDGGLDYEVDEKNRDTHYAENCERVFREAEITFKGRKFSVVKSELAMVAEGRGGLDDAVVDEVVFRTADESLVAGKVWDTDADLEPVPRKSRLRGGNQSLWTGLGTWTR